MDTINRDGRLVGIPASPGTVIGVAVWVHQVPAVQLESSISSDAIQHELLRLKEAVENAKSEITNLRNRVMIQMGPNEAAVFDAHLSFLEDPEYVGQIEMLIRTHSMGAESVVFDVTRRMKEMLMALPDEYLQARADDLQDVGTRVLRLLAGQRAMNLSSVKSGSVVVAEELTPSNLAELPREIGGIVTARGSRTSHVVIMAKSIGIPFIVGVGESIQRIKDGDLLVLDGNQGTVLVRPTMAEQRQAQHHIEVHSALHNVALAEAKNPAITRDGRRIAILANIGHLRDVPEAVKNGAEGVGLFRTEFLYLENDHWPTEQEQYEVYRKVLESFTDKPVIIRTLDIGGDKPLGYANLPQEPNPFLGHRAIRYCLDNPDVFKTQLRALLRASLHGKLSIMLPMISTLSEILLAKGIIDQCKRDLNDEGVAIVNSIPVGIMVEIPAAAVMADILVQEIDFFSIGTNDLAQYTLAVDRGNERVAHLYDAAHPAVLRLIQQTCDAGIGTGIPVGMCGELAGDLEMTEALVGLGLDELSMSSTNIPMVKQRIREIDGIAAKSLVKKLLKLTSAEEVRAATFAEVLGSQ
ncbi:phosphoenolpyruvate--protein phosphotransferase [Alicyclobacillaceae bacterium I2511]|nr:phosphoenolpyruvate--protein phosphotransferase [Alicyclobacillaceae bacterium I2511]